MILGAGGGHCPPWKWKAPLSSSAGSTTGGVVVEGGTGLGLCQLDVLTRPQGTWRFWGHARNFDELSCWGGCVRASAAPPCTHHPSSVCCPIHTQTPKFSLNLCTRSAHCLPTQTARGRSHCSWLRRTNEPFTMIVKASDQHS